MLNKLRIKFICIMMSVIAIMLCVIFGLVIGFTGRNLEQESIEALQMAASDPGLFFGRRDDRSNMPYFIMSRDLRGGFSVSGTISSADYSKDKFREIWDAAYQTGGQTGELEDYDLRFQRILNPMGESFVFLDISSHRLAMESLTRVCVIVGFLSFFVFLGASVLLAHWAVRPVEQAWNRQRQFVGDASHELKTPLTVIMTNAELLQDPGYDEAAKKQFSDSILTMSRQMRGLVEGLLELARVDNGAVKTGFAECDMSGLTEDGVLPFEPLYFEKGLTLTTRIESGIRLKGCESHLHQVLDILLDNAMKYSAPGGTVRVGLKKQGAHCLLSVASPGAPISREDLDNIFKRFYRLDKARSRDGSYGLGLSIAHSIVSEHKGKIWAESREGINTFFVQLPIN